MFPKNIFTGGTEMATFSTLLYDAQLYYDDRGSGQPVVFVHGWSSNSKFFDPLIQPLLTEGKYRVISYDQRGHGASSGCDKGLTMQQLGRDLHDLIAALGLKDVTLIGHSMGAMTIYSYIDQYGCENIKKCVFIDMSPKLLNDENWNLGYRKVHKTLELLEADMDEICEDFDRFLFRFYGEVLPVFKSFPEAIELLIRPGLIGLNDRKILALLWWSMFRADFRSAIDKITVPVLYFYPDSGLYPKEVAADFMTEHCKAGVKVVECANASHMVPMEQPAFLVDEILSFI